MIQATAFCQLDRPSGILHRHFCILDEAMLPLRKRPGVFECCECVASICSLAHVQERSATIKASTRARLRQYVGVAEQDSPWRACLWPLTHD